MAINTGFTVPRLNYDDIGPFDYRKFLTTLLNEEWELLPVDEYTLLIARDLRNSQGITPQELFVVECRFRGMTLRAVADKVARTRERIRSIEAKALRKFRHHSRLTTFHKALEEDKAQLFCDWIDGAGRQVNYPETGSTCATCGRAFSWQLTSKRCPAKQQAVSRTA